ncbi:MAG: hypothetical protein U1B80_05915, partial [Anaerolineaceae bacterium]|nr:hypothetical protein [Anaerolineaceae bacterium]
DVCLLSLADTLATYGYELSRERWQLELELTCDLLHAWWEKPNELVRPTPLLNGSDLQKQLDLSPGPTIGMLLSELAEAQAGGEIATPSEALILARNLLQRYGG